MGEHVSSRNRDDRTEWGEGGLGVANWIWVKKQPLGSSLQSWINCLLHGVTTKSLGRCSGHHSRHVALMTSRLSLVLHVIQSHLFKGRLKQHGLLVHRFSFLCILLFWTAMQGNKPRASCMPGCIDSCAASLPTLSWQEKKKFKDNTLLYSVNINSALESLWMLSAPTVLSLSLYYLSGGN